jgi:carboxylesterase type B
MHKRNYLFYFGSMGKIIYYLPIVFVLMSSSGGYQFGDAVGYNGTDQISTAKGGVVVVTISYRLGLFGFLSGKEVKKDGALNAGLCAFLASSGYENWLIPRIVDQQFALHWVQEHVSF